MSEVYDQPRQYTPPLFGDDTPEMPIEQAQQQPEMEVDMLAVREGIMGFSGDDVDYAKELINHHIGGQYGKVPKQTDYASNMKAYFDDEEADPLQVIELLKAEYKPKDDEAYTKLQDYQTLTSEEKWNRISHKYERESYSGVGATGAVYVPGYTVPDEEKPKLVAEYERELQSESRTWKLEQGRALSDKAKSLARTIAITKKQPSTLQLSRLTSRERQVLPIYLSGLNPTKSTEGWSNYTQAVIDVGAQSISDVRASFKETGEQIVSSLIGVDDPEEFYLRFSSEFKDKFNKEELTAEDQKELRNWLTKQVVGFDEDELQELPYSPLNEQRLLESQPKINDLIQNLDSHLQAGKQFREEEKLQKRIDHATRALYDKSGFKGLTLSSIPIAADLAGAAASGLAAGPAGVVGYSSGRIYGDLVEEIVDAGGDPQEARAISAAALLPYAFLEKVQVNKLVPQASFKEFSKQFIKAIETRNIKEFTKGAALKGGSLSKDFLSTWGSETLTEVAQEIVLTAAKKASSDAEFDNRALLKNLEETFIESARGMFLISAAGTGVRGIAGTPGDFNQVNQAEAIEEQFEDLSRQEIQDIGLGNLIAEDFKDAEDKTQVLEDSGLIDTDQDLVETAIEVQEEQVKELEKQEAEEIAAIEEAPESKEALQLMTNKLSEFADISETKDGLRITTDKGYDVDLKFESDLTSKGRFNGKTAAIYLRPDQGTATFNHEFFHSMEDMGLLSRAEVESLDKLAKKYLPSVIQGEVNWLYSGRGGKNLLRTERVARFFEEWTKNPDMVPQDDRNVLQKIVDFIRDMIGKYISSVGKSGHTVAKEVMSGKALERAPSKIGLRLMEEARLAKDKFDAVFPSDTVKFALDKPTVKNAATILARDIFTKNISSAKQDSILTEFGIQEADFQEVKQRAHDIVAQIAEPMRDVQDDAQILKAIRKEAIRQDYKQKVEELYKKGLAEGEIIEKAREKIKRRKKDLKQDVILSQSAIDNVADMARSLSDSLGVDKFLNDLEQLAKRVAFKGKVPVNFQRDPKFMGTFLSSIESATNHLLKNIPPGAEKQKLRQDIKKLRGYTTYKAINNNAKKLLNNIISKAAKSDLKTVQKELNKTLKKYSKKPKAREENKKRSIDGQAHLFLYQGNKARKMNKEAVRDEMESLENDMARYSEGLKVGDDIRYNEAEIKYRSYMIFGGLSRADASLADTISALEYAEKVEADGKALVERLQQEHNEKYAPISKDIIDAVTSAKDFVKKKDEKTKLDAIFDTFETMNVRGQLEFVTQYGTDAQKKSLQKILLGNDSSKIGKKQRIAEANKQLDKVAKDLGIKNIQQFAIDRSKISKEFQKYSHEERTELSRANLMQLYMTFRQPDIIELSAAVNNDGDLINPDLYRRIQLMPEIRKELTDQEKRLAESMGDILNTLLPDINDAYKKQYGVNMKVQEENYWPLKVQSKKGGYASQMATVSEAPGFTIQRVAHSNDLDERADIFEVFSGHIEDAAHYVETIDSQLAIRSTLTNRDFREAVRQTYGKEILKKLDESIVDMAIDRALVSDQTNELIDMTRSIMSTISIGFNPKSVVVAGIGAVNVFATHGGTMRAISNISKNPEQYQQDLKFIWNSVVVQNRLDQGLNEHMRNAMKKAKGNKFWQTYQDWGFAPLANTDAFLATLTGAAIYNDYKNSEAAAGLTQEQVEKNGLAIVDRAIQEAYQPTDPDYLPAAIRRGGSAAKALFQFKTEPMSKLGIYVKDWKAAKAMYDKGDKIGAAKKAINIVFGQHVIIPGAYWLAGELMRFVSGEEMDEEDMLKRLMTGMLLGPYSGLLITGTGLELLAKSLTGDKIFLGSSTPSDRVVNEVKFLFDRATDWDDEDFTEKIDKIMRQYNPVYKYTLKAIEK